MIGHLAVTALSLVSLAPIKFVLRHNRDRDGAGDGAGDGDGSEQSSATPMSSSEAAPYSKSL